MGVCCTESVKNQIQEPDIGALNKKPMKNMAVEVPKKKLKVYGNHFNNDTRTILTLLDIAKHDYEYEEINIFMGEHK